MNTRLVAVAVGAVILGSAIGFAAKPAEIMTVEVPYPSAVEVIVPSPYPSEVLVAVIPEACQIYIDALLDEDIANLDFIISIYDAYLDYPDENLEEFGVRVEAILTAGAPDAKPAADDASACDR